MRNSSSLDWLRFMHTPNDYRVSLKYSKEEIIRFDPKVNLKDLEIKQFNPEHPLNELNRLNKLKKSNPEAFHYWYQIYKIIQENK